MSNLSKPENTDTASVMAKAEALENRPKKPSLAKREPSQGLSPNDFQLPQSPEINIQRQQREAAQGSQEYAQGVSAAHAIASTQAYQFKQGYADGLNDAMPAVGRDVADYVEGGERAVSNFFRDFTAQIKGH